MLDQLLPCLGQIGALAEPLHERDIQTALQFLDLMRDRRLRQEFNSLAAAVKLPCATTSTNALS